MEKHDIPNTLQKLLYAVFKKKIRSLEDVREFSEIHDIPFNTVKDYFYKGGAAGINTINQILTKLFHLDEDKTSQILNTIENTEPVSESVKIWNSIKVDESKKIHYATIARAIWEIERDLEKFKK